MTHSGLPVCWALCLKQFMTVFPLLSHSPGWVLLLTLFYRGGVVVLGELIAHKQSCQGCHPPRGHLSLSLAPALTLLVHGQVFILLKLANLLSGSPLVSHPD